MQGLTPEDDEPKAKGRESAGSSAKRRNVVRPEPWEEDDSEVMASEAEMESDEDDEEVDVESDADIEDEVEEDYRAESA